MFKQLLRDKRRECSRWVIDDLDILPEKVATDTTVDTPKAIRNLQYSFIGPYFHPWELDNQWRKKETTPSIHF